MPTSRHEPPDGARLPLRVNPIKCAAFGFCAEYAPELFELDEWGYAWLHTPDVPEDLARLAEEAAALCPVRAIYLRRVAREAARAVGATTTPSQAGDRRAATTVARQAPSEPRRHG